MGLIFRAVGRSDFYQFEWYTKGKPNHKHSEEVGLMYAWSRKWKRLLPAIKRPSKLNKWYEFKVVVRGSAIKCYIDGRKIFSVQDSVYYQPGKVGLRIWGNTQVAVKNFKVKRL